MLLNISKLGRTGVSFDFEVLIFDQRIILVMHTYLSILATRKSSSPVHVGSMGISNFYHSQGT